MAEMLQSDYVYSYKCSPTDLAVPNIDEDYIRANLESAGRAALKVEALSAPPVPRG